ncbi:hypothetical protein CUJ83_01830 [Methanocella sp. CWC-04]|uniref:Uncharacterized protein n=1 Tax=Methanooceanicella nereidis TaxID=2052831 RepID=A0AAP2RA48_9EURY|nr:hypothetical protein [Methanocella sp. CWC-04]MCD1293734.1 hypothetical protein [Methanocella sp. CWC-04]
MIALLLATIIFLPIWLPVGCICSPVWVPVIFIVSMMKKNKPVINSDEDSARNELERTLREQVKIEEESVREAYKDLEGDDKFEKARNFNRW